jgi:hypothetical protein
MAKTNADRNGKAIQSLEDLRREKAKAQERLTYTESLIEEEWETLRDQVRPKAVLSNVERLLPLLTNAGPLGRITSGLANALFKRKKSSSAQEEAPDNDKSQRSGNSWGGRLKKGFYRALVPFILGTAATATFFQRGRD